MAALPRSNSSNKSCNCVLLLHQIDQMIPPLNTTPASSVPLVDAVALPEALQGPGVRGARRRPVAPGVAAPGAPVAALLCPLRRRAVVVVVPRHSRADVLEAVAGVVQRRRGGGAGAVGAAAAGAASCIVRLLLLLLLLLLEAVPARLAQVEDGAGVVLARAAAVPAMRRLAGRQGGRGGGGRRADRHEDRRHQRSEVGVALPSAEQSMPG